MQDELLKFLEQKGSSFGPLNLCRLQKYFHICFFYYKIIITH